VSNNALFDAIRSGSSDNLKKALADGAGVNDSLMGYSPLMLATLNGTTDQMKILIDHGANVNWPGADSVTALWLAIPDMEKTQLLLDHGADPQHKIKGNGILVKLAAIPGTITLFQLLIARGVDPKTNAVGNFTLYNAASSGDTALVGLLLRAGLQVNDTTAFGEVPVNAALNFKTFATLKMLVDNGADVNFQNLKEPIFPQLIGFTPLMNSALSNDKRSVLYLLDHGADPNLRNKTGFTALMLWEQSDGGDAEVTQALIDHGARVSDEAPDGTDALYYAMEKGNTPTVALLKKYKNQ
jgi:ankyrin repeat protein